VISCVVTARNPDVSLLRVTVKSALDAGVNEVVLVDNGSDEPIVMPRARTRVVRFADTQGEDDAFRFGAIEARYEWIVRLEAGDAILGNKIRQVGVTVAQGADGSVSPHYDTAADRDVWPESTFKASTAVMRRDAVLHDNARDWRVFPEVTAIAQPSSRAIDIDFSSAPTETGAVRDDAAQCVVETENG